MIPPVTLGGRNLPVVANLFDDTGNFRQRNGSFKRQRVEGGGAVSRDGYYDLSRDAAVAAPPSGPKLDIGKIRGLMVKANEMAEIIRTKYVLEAVPDGVRDLAGFSMALLDLVNAVVEEGIIPMSSSTPASFASVAAASNPANPPQNRTRTELGPLS
jgi:hypothetical protein